MAVILDATALMAYLGREPGYDIVKENFIKATQTNENLLMSFVNWGEVYYKLIQDHGVEKTEGFQKIIETFPIDFVEPNFIITKQAGLYKAIKKLPYADSFAAAMTRLNKGELITGDNDFRLVKDEIKIIWIR